MINQEILQKLAEKLYSLCVLIDEKIDKLIENFSKCLKIIFKNTNIP